MVGVSQSRSDPPPTRAPALPVWVLVLDAQGRITAVDERFRAMLAPGTAPCAQTVEQVLTLPRGRTWFGPSPFAAEGGFFSPGTEWDCILGPPWVQEELCLHARLELLHTPHGAATRVLLLAPCSDVDCCSLFGRPPLPRLDTLRKAEQRYQVIFEKAPLGIFTSTLQGRYLEVNQALAAMLGYTHPAEVMAKIRNIALDVYVYPERRDQIIARLTETGVLSNFENVYRRRDGSIFTASLNVTTLQDPESGERYLLGLVEDITERKQAEQALRESQERYSSIFANAPVGIYQSTPQGRYLSVNPQFATMHGFESPEEVLRLVNDIGEQLYVTPQRREEMLRLLLRDGEVSNFEVHSRRKDGSTFWTARNVRLMRDSKGMPNHLKGFVTDISKQKELERLREDVERITRHDIKSPLVSLVLGVRMLRKEENITPFQAELLHEMEKSGSRMLNMINLSLDLYKMETGTYALDPQPLDLLAVLRKTARDALESERHKQLSLRFECEGRAVGEEDRFLVLGEELLCYSMFANLLNNAAQASPPGATVDIFVERKAAYASVCIHNQGAVPPDVRPLFFEKYATSGKRYGTGLGTYSARLIALTLGGEISYSTSEEEGTTLRVLVPLPH